MQTQREELTILMTTDTVGGVWSYSLSLAKALNVYNIKILLATMGGKLNVSQRKQVDQIPNVRLFESEYKLEWMPNPWKDVRNAGKWLIQIAEEYKPDIVHLNGYAHGLIDWPCPCLIVGHSCVYSWFKAVRRQEPCCQEWKKYLCIVAKALKKADLVTAPTASFLKELKQLYGPFYEVGETYNGIDADDHRVGEKEAIVFSAGRLWDEAKNIQILDKAADYINAPVYVAGNNLHPDGRLFEAKKLNCLGILSSSEMAQWYSRAAVYVMPAKYEPFGLTALEAALAGCALVLGDIQTFREIWRETALFVDPDNEKELAEAINYLIENPEIRLQYAKKARNNALLYSAKKMADEYFKLYKSLLNTTAVGFFNYIE